MRQNTENLMVFLYFGAFCLRIGVALSVNLLYDTCAPIWSVTGYQYFETTASCEGIRLYQRREERI